MDLLDSIKNTLGKDDDPEEFAEETLSEQEDLPKTATPRGRETGDYLGTVEASLLRTELAGRFDDQRKRVSELQHELISQAKIEFLDDLERAVMKLQLLIDRIKTASYGYAGLFDAVKVKEEQLDALYAFDNQMLGFADEVSADVDHVTSAITAGEGIGDAIRALVDTVGEANQAFGHREEAILQAGML
jgi:hypothetical protein